MKTLPCGGTLLDHPRRARTQLRAYLIEIVADNSTATHGTAYTLDGQITGWRSGNAAKRLIVGLGSGREAADIQYRLVDASGHKILEHRDTIRTNFFSQAAGSTGTLAHPFAQKITEQIKEA